MERKMRRFKQQLTLDECLATLNRATSGVLALCGDDREPYGVPLSHVCHDGKIYFHSALSGHKVDLIVQNPNASFTVIAQDEIHPENYTTYFKSVIAFGKVRIIDDESDKLRVLEILGRRCNPEDAEGLAQEIESGFSRCIALEMSIDRISGKQAIEMVGRE